MKVLSAILAGLIFAVACVPSLPSSPPAAETVKPVAPEASELPGDVGGMSDGVDVEKGGTRHVVVPNGPYLLHAPQRWVAAIRVDKCMGDLTPEQRCMQPFETVESLGNLLTTNGAGQLWTGLSTAIATPWNTTNTMLAVGDSSTAPGASQVDLQASLATKINAADVSSCTNATPVVCTGTYSPAPAAGEVYAFSGFSGAGGTVLNNTWELSAGSAGSLTVLNTASPGTITVTGGVIQKVNKYRQLANAAGSAVVSTNQIVYVATFGTTNANFAWNEWGTTTGGAATNKQAAPPPFLLNRAIPSLGTKTSAASWTLTVTLSLT